MTAAKNDDIFHMNDKQKLAFNDIWNSLSRLFVTNVPFELTLNDKKYTLLLYTSAIGEHQISYQMSLISPSLVVTPVERILLHDLYDMINNKR